MHIFTALAGNDRIKNLLGDDLIKKTHSHAYILEGPVGSGRHTAAFEIAKALLCQTSGERLPCEQCVTCKKINTGFHTDILFTTREKTVITVEQIRNLRETLSYAPDEGDYKIYIIEDAEKMTTAAQNALLLSLEEPPAYVVFLLLTTDATALLETVRSRAPVVRMELFSTDFIVKWLAQTEAGKTASLQTLSKAASVSGGALGTALSVLSGNGSLSPELEARDEAEKLVSRLLSDAKAETVIYASGLKLSREAFDRALSFSMTAVRDLIAYKTGSERFLFYTSQKDAEAVCNKASTAKLASVYKALESARGDIVNSNAFVYTVMSTLAAQPE